MIKKLFNKLFKKKDAQITITNLNATGSLIGYSSILLPSGAFTQQTYSDYQNEIDKQKEILNSFDNDVKMIYEEIKIYIYDGFYTTSINSGHIKVCEILEKHLKINKFNNKLEDIINE